MGKHANCQRTISSLLSIVFLFWGYPGPQSCGDLSLHCAENRREGWRVSTQQAISLLFSQCYPEAEWWERQPTSFSVWPNRLEVIFNCLMINSSCPKNCSDLCSSPVIPLIISLNVDFCSEAYQAALYFDWHASGLCLFQHVCTCHYQMTSCTVCSHPYYACS